jgi:hypothetical protein
VETVENGIFHVRQAIFFRSSEIFCGETLHPRWILCGKSQKRGEGDRFPEFFDVSAMPKPSLWIGSAVFSVEYPARIFLLIHRGLWIKSRPSAFPQSCGEFVHTSNRGVCVEKGGFFAKTGGFWRFTQTFPFLPVQNFFFPHGFPQPVEK